MNMYEDTINCAAWDSYIKEKEEQGPKLVEGKIIKIRAELSEITAKKAIEKIDETKSWFFEKLNKLANL